MPSHLPLSLDPLTASVVSSLGGWANLTPAGLLIIVVMMVLLGVLIPRWVYTQLLEEVKYLRTAIKEEQAGRTKAIETTVKALAAVEKFEEVLDSFRGITKQMPGQGGDADEVALPVDQG